MNTQEKEVVVVSEEPIPANRYVDGAQAQLQELRLMRERVPRFVIPTSKKDMVRLNNVASVSSEFVELTAVAVANQRSLVREEAATPAEMRDLMSYAEAYSPFADELEAFAHFVRFSVNAARHRAGSEALAVYAIAQRLAKMPATAGLAPHVADMRRALGRFRKLTAEQAAKRKAAKAAKAGTTPPPPAAPPVK